jgi:hypothetical protein
MLMASDIVLPLAVLLLLIIVLTPLILSMRPSEMDEMAEAAHPDPDWLEEEEEADAPSEG